MMTIDCDQTATLETRLARAKSRLANAELSEKTMLAMGDRTSITYQIALGTVVRHRKTVRALEQQLLLATSSNDSTGDDTNEQPMSAPVDSIQSTSTASDEPIESETTSNSTDDNVLEEVIRRRLNRRFFLPR